MKTADNFLKPIDPKIGSCYHLSWAKRGCVWNLISIDKELGTCVLRTQVSKKTITAKIDDLRHTRKTMEKIKFNDTKTT